MIIYTIQRLEDLYNLTFFSFNLIRTKCMHHQLFLDHYAKVSEYFFLIFSLSPGNLFWVYGELDLFLLFYKLGALRAEPHSIVIGVVLYSSCYVASLV